MSETPVNPYLVPSTATHASGAGLPNTPRPPAVGLPVERIPGSYPDVSDGDAEAKQHGYEDTGKLSIVPTPLIGAIPYGGLVISAGRWQPTIIGQTITIGDTGASQPQNTAVIFSTDSPYGTFEIVGDGLKDQPGLGGVLPVGVQVATSVGFVPVVPLWLPLRRVTIRSPFATGTLSFIVVGYPVGGH